MIKLPLNFKKINRIIRNVKNNKITKLIISVVLSLAIGFAGSLATSQSVQTWYPTLRKPPLTPPNWIFAPVWTLLYICLGVVLYFLSKEAKKYSELLKLFLIQLGLNAIWSPVFFGLQQPLLALMIIAGLWLILLIVISEAWNQKRIVFWLLLPYFIWISFASYLNAGILLLN